MRGSTMYNNTALSEKVKPKLWIPEDLAEYLSVPVSWVYKRCRQSSDDYIPHLKMGKYVRFDPEDKDFQGWLRQHKTQATHASSSIV